MSEIKRTDTRAVDPYIKALANSMLRPNRTASTGNNVVGLYAEGLPTIITGGLRLSQHYQYDPADLPDDENQFMSDQHACLACDSPMHFNDSTDSFECDNPKCPEAMDAGEPYHQSREHTLENWREKHRNRSHDDDEEWDDIEPMASTNQGRKAKSGKFIRVS